ncbi:MAG: GIY-YIG nuclease family protein [Flammeovirgaceae bacterium]|nr:GIY-YIG nuclease family protein [Flammeovirgaceae bacterium]
MESYCYIIFSKKLNKFYVGSTVSFPERLKEHKPIAYGKTKFTSLINTLNSSVFPF